MTTKIEWVKNADGSSGKTWNPTAGCTIVSPGCSRCYAMRMARRFDGRGIGYDGTTQPSKGGPVWTGVVNLLPDRLSIPLKRKKPTTWFVNSMSDLFHESIPLSYIQRVFNVMLEADWHTFQILTKRAQRLEALGPKLLWPINVWMGVSVESDQYLDRIHRLRQTSAAIRFLSLEPLLGPLDHLPLGGIDWVIVGGESGAGARPMHPDWARSIRDQCVASGVPYFFKQWGAHRPLGHGGNGMVVTLEDGTRMLRCSEGKHEAGRELDGRTWDEMPGPGTSTAEQQEITL